MLARHPHEIFEQESLRVTELVSLRLDAIDLSHGTIHVNRLKNGRDSTHPLSGREIRELRRLKREYSDTAHVFVTERGGPMTGSNVRKMLTKAGKGLGISVHPHMTGRTVGGL